VLRRNRLVTAGALVAIVVALGSAPALGDPGDGSASGSSDGEAASARGNATDSTPALPAGTRNTAQPNCVTSSGQPDFISYGPLLVTTQDEQRNEIRPWEQRPGQWAHQYCGGEWVDFVFLPDAAPVDPRVIAQAVFARIRPDPPKLRVNPDIESPQLVNLDTWLWVDPASWQPISDGDSAGLVSVTVTAEPKELRFNMGDGKSVVCDYPGTPYDPSRPAAEQSTECFHTYRHSSADQPDQRYTVTVTMVYTASWSSSGAVVDGGDLGTLESDATVRLRVAEGQAIVT